MPAKMKTDGPKKNAMLRIRATEEDIEQWAAVAEACGVPVSVWIRNLAQAAVAKHKKK